MSAFGTIQREIYHPLFSGWYSAGGSDRSTMGVVRSVDVSSRRRSVSTETPDAVGWASSARASNNSAAVPLELERDRVARAASHLSTTVARYLILTNLSRDAKRTQTLSFVVCFWWNDLLTPLYLLIRPEFVPTFVAGQVQFIAGCLGELAKKFVTGNARSVVCAKMMHCYLTCTRLRSERCVLLVASSNKRLHSPSELCKYFNFYVSKGTGLLPYRCPI